MRDLLGTTLGDLRVKAVLPYVRGRLLDLGCGSNQLLHRYGCGVGVDVHPWAGVDLIVEDCSKLPFEGCSFDTVALVASLNHIPNRADVLEECRRVLRPDGQVLVTMLAPLTSRIWHWLRAPWDADQRERGMKAGEVYGFTRRAMIKLFRAHGFQFVSHRRFMLGFNRVYVFCVQPREP